MTFPCPGSNHDRLGKQNNTLSPGLPPRPVPTPHREDTPKHRQARAHASSSWAPGP